MIDSIVDNGDRNCTGCSSCAIICPQNAITMDLDEDGFYSPTIDHQLCINCGKCKKNCYKYPQLCDVTGHVVRKIYRAWNKDDNIRAVSTSGGVGNAIARWGVENGYSIVGVEYDYTNNVAQHVVVNTNKSLIKIIGSKYIPSLTLPAFKMINTGGKYLVFGTPCQIAPLYKLYKKKMGNKLIIVDVFCFGHPGYNLWNKYMQFLSKNNKIECISYINQRSKLRGWRISGVEIKHAKGTYFKSKEFDPFCIGYRSGKVLKKSCYGCLYSRVNSLADIRFGDAWTLPTFDNKGTSVVVTFSEDGCKIIEDLRIECQIDEVDADLKNMPWKIAVESVDAKAALKTDIPMNLFIKKYFNKWCKKRNLSIINRIKYKLLHSIIPQPIYSKIKKLFYRK